jgi:hypothetical protein
MAGHEFKGVNDYSQVVLTDVQRCITKAVKALSDADHNFAFVEGCELDYQVVESCKQLLMNVSDNLYARKS